MAEKLSLSLHQAQLILDHSSRPLFAQSITQIEPHLSYTKNANTYAVGLSTSKDASESLSCFITISLPKDDDDEDSDYHPNSLQVIADLISRISSHTSLPIKPVKVDASRGIVPYPYLLTPPGPYPASKLVLLSEAEKKGMTDEEKAVVDLWLGKYLAELHLNVQNDWFGLPQTSDPREPSYSWQETFTLVLDTLLTSAQSSGVLDDDFPFESMHASLSRAIGFFLFDDVEAPSLVLTTLSKSSVFLVVGNDGGSQVAAILPQLSHAMWGDPLLESFFFEGARSKALMEGYIGAGGADPLVFPRQRTKRMWYDVLVALVVLLEDGQGNDEREWALDMLRKRVVELKDAPCY